MTILTKANLCAMPPVLSDDKKQLFLEGGSICTEDSDSVFIKKKGLRSIACILVMSILLVGTAVILGLLLYDAFMNNDNPTKRYQGYCSIPMDILNRVPEPAQEQLIEPKYDEQRVLPHWTSDPEAVQIFSSDEDAANAFVNSLREEFDVGGRVETIRVFENGRTISFIHNFDDNVTGIVDEDRCFLMDLDPSLVLAPELLMFAIETGQDMDVTRVHTTLRALLPALRDLKRQAEMLLERCQNKPTYRLESSGTVIRKKRSLELPSHDYIQFAGKHVQEIKISNLQELLDHEKNNK